MNGIQKIVEECKTGDALDVNKLIMKCTTPKSSNDFLIHSVYDYCIKNKIPIIITKEM